MKSYTDLEQSHKLIELGLDPSTADMCYPKDAFEYHYDKEPVCHYTGIGLAHPCWSVSALLNLMPETIILDGQEAFYKLKRENAIWKLYYESNFNYREEHSLELIEAVYSMVCWLLENGYIKKDK